MTSLSNHRPEKEKLHVSRGELAVNAIHDIEWVLEGRRYACMATASRCQLNARPEQLRCSMEITDNTHLQAGLHCLISLSVKCALVSKDLEQLMHRKQQAAH